MEALLAEPALAMMQSAPPAPRPAGDDLRQLAFEARHDFEAYCRLCAPWPLAPHQRVYMAPVDRIECTPGAQEMLAAWPQSGKTSIATVLGLQWILGRSYCTPQLGDIRSVILASYNTTKADSISGAVQAAFTDPGHPARLVWPDVKLTAGGKGQWSLNKQPSNEPTFVSIGVGGGTGYPAQLIWLDDYVKGLEEAFSEAYHENTKLWWAGSMMARKQGGDAATRTMVTATRWSERDLVGQILAEQRDRWHYTALPATIGEGDDRRSRWPEKYPLEHLDLVREQQGPRYFNALFMCNPTPAEGLVWKREWFDQARYKPGEAPDPSLLTMCCAWDCTPPKEQAKDPSKTDYVGYCRIGRDSKGEFWVYKAGRDKYTAEGLRQAVAYGFGGSRNEVAAVENDANGKWVMSGLQGCGRALVPIDPVADKVTRAKLVSPLAETHRVHICLDAEGEELIRTLCAFPNDPHDDVHDALVNGLRRLNEGDPDMAFFAVRI